MKVYRIVAQSQNCGWSGDGSGELKTTGTRAALRRALLKAARPYGRGAWARVYDPAVTGPYNEVAGVTLAVGFHTVDTFTGAAE